ncbi:hypothetical protein [Roseobacter sp. S98]|uniref:hypothetical protein n=1 Tax=Roseobacter algicola (ex Choi et al. 2025) (nom. illeg.) TaxID=3092138 RepID=UPI0035C71A7F
MPCFNNFGRTCFHLAAALFLWGAAQDAAAQSPHQELIEQLDQVASGLEATGETDAALRQSLENLAARINAALNPTDEEISAELTASAATIRGSLDNGTIAPAIADLREAVFDYEDARKDQFLSMLVDALTTHTSQELDFVSNETRRKVLTLETVIGKVDLLSVEDSISARAGILSALIQASSPVAGGTVQIPALTGLRQVLESVDRNLFYTALDNRITLMTEMLEPSGDIAKVLRLADVAKLTTLSSKIDAVVPGDKTQKPGVYVVSARYGRLSGPVTGGSCDVRATMAKQCHGQKKCTLPDDGAGSFCGGQDPAPFAQSRHKGTSVTYACLNLTDQQWADVFSRRPSSYQGPTRHDVLRSAADEIQCGF